MSIDEDTELRDLVTQTLEVNGCLSKIRAQLRANIFLALDEDEDLQKKSPFQNDKIRTHLQSAEGRLMFCLVREFLEFFNLDFTISVFEPESYLGTAYTYEGRSKIIDDLSFKSEIDENLNIPLLLHLIKLTQFNKGTNDTNNETRKPAGTTLSEIPESNIKPANVDPNMQENKIDTFTKKSNYALNETFDISNGNINKQENNGNSQIYADKDSTVNSTISVIEDISKDNISFLIDLDKSLRSSSVNNSQADGEKSKSFMDQSIIEHEKSPTVHKENKFITKFETTIDKIKLSPQKTDKFKTKSNLSSLSDLPPLQLNKPRDTMVLPSLYNKEFRDKKSDFDKFLDVDTFDNYEEDFMSSGELELGLTNMNLILNDSSKSKGEDNSNQLSNSHKKTNGTNSNCDKKESSNKTESVASSVSEELNVDDILTSSASN